MPRRIVIKGTSAAGKSTVAAALAKRLGLTHIELDALHHGPNWQAATPEELRARALAAMAAAPNGWVIDGNYDGKLEGTVLDAADTIVWLDLPLGVKLVRLLRRTLHRVRHDVELWNGNRETWRDAFFSLENSLFPWLVRTHHEHRREWPIQFADDPRLVRLRSVAETRAWLRAQSAGE